MACVRWRARTLLCSLLLAAAVRGQDSALERIKSEAARVRATPLPANGYWPDTKVVRGQLAGFHAAVRDWIDAVLPRSRAGLDAELMLLNMRIISELERAGVFGDEDATEFKPGIVTRAEISRSADDPEKVTVIVGLGVPCGSDDAVYVYDYGQVPPRRVLELHGTRDHDESLSQIRFSNRDAAGRQLLLTVRYAVQCGSSWNRLVYDLFRLRLTGTPVSSILSADQGIWFNAEIPYHVRLQPDELLIELRDRSMDGGILVRTHVLRYRVTDAAVDRIDPVALQPQDFVDEWLTRP